MNSTNIIAQKYVKENPYRVPHGYFESMPQRIGEKIDQISSPKRSNVYMRSFQTSLRSQLALAASLILMMGLGYGVLRIIIPGFTDSDLSYTENISLFNSYSLLQNDEWEEDLDSEDIISFLTDQGISPNAIAFLD